MTWTSSTLTANLKGMRYGGKQHGRGGGLQLHKPSVEEVFAVHFWSARLLGKELCSNGDEGHSGECVSQVQLFGQRTLQRCECERHGPLENVQGTSGPRDITPEGLREAARRQADNTGLSPKLPPMAMWLHVEERRPWPSTSLSERYSLILIRRHTHTLYYETKRKTSKLSCKWTLVAMHPLQNHTACPRV